MALDNLIDLIVACIGSQSAANQVFLVSDGQDISTTELILLPRGCVGKARQAGARALRDFADWRCSLGKSNVAGRLCDNLQVDIGKTTAIEGKPPISVHEGLRHRPAFSKHRELVVKRLSILFWR